MKRYVKAASKPNKRELRSTFIDLATAIRDMSKYEFVQILKNNDFETAQQWIDELETVYDRLKLSAQDSIKYVVAKVIVDSKFVGYVENLSKKAGSRGWQGRLEVDVTDDIDQAMTFSSQREADLKLLNIQEIGVYLDNGTGYRYDPYYADKAGQLDEFGSKIVGMNIYHAGSIIFEYEDI